MVLLVLLVLTTIGTSLAFLVSSDDRASGMDRLQLAGLYAAEAGLREGEASLGALAAALIDPSSLLPSAAQAAAHEAPAGSRDLPGGGLRALALRAGGTPLVEQVVSSALPDRSARLVFSLFVRNNVEDPGGACRDTDGKVNLVSIGEYVTVGAGGEITSRGIQKALEEQLDLGRVGSPASAAPRLLMPSWWRELK